jgi:hypothetical protein
VNLDEAITRLQALKVNWPSATVVVSIGSSEKELYDIYEENGEVIIRGV